VVSDETFDAVFPEDVRHLSERHWTPLEVVSEVVRMLAPDPAQRILDVGAGAGKFCLAAALAAPGAWYGVEHDRALVRAAYGAARRLGVADRAYFVHGDLDSIDWTQFDAFYLFNPIDSAISQRASLSAFERYALVRGAVSRIQARLAVLPPGTRVVTFHGFGGEMPPGFELVERKHVRDGDLCLWVQAPLEGFAA
jgi:SAM-dependent methyltransferase